MAGNFTLMHNMVFKTEILSRYLLPQYVIWLFKSPVLLNCIILQETQEWVWIQPEPAQHCDLNGARLLPPMIYWVTDAQACCYKCQLISKWNSLWKSLLLLKVRPRKANVQKGKAGDRCYASVTRASAPWLQHRRLSLKISEGLQLQGHLYSTGNMYTLALSKHPIQKSPRNTEKALFIPSMPCSSKHLLPTPEPAREQEKRLAMAGLALAHPQPCLEPPQAKPFPKRAELGTSETQGESSGYLFLLGTHLWCVNSRSIWQHFERQLKDSPDAIPGKALSSTKPTDTAVCSCCLLYCNLCTNRARKWGCCHL